MAYDQIVAQERALNEAEETTEQRPYLGQRCHIEGKGFGTIVLLTFEVWNGVEDVPCARVDLDMGGVPWFQVADLELLAL